MIRVAIVEDDSGYRARLSAAIAADNRMQLVATCADCAEAFELIGSDAALDVLLVDLGLPDGSGADVIRAVHRRGSATETMVLTVFADERHVVGAIEAGATGYLLKDESPAEIAAGIVELVQGGSPISSGIARYIIKRMQVKPEAAAPSKTSVHLTAKEKDVLELLAKGFSAPEIGTMLAISTHTVFSHAKQIYRKLAVHNRSEAVYEAMQQGLIDVHTGVRELDVPPAQS